MAEKSWCEEFVSIYVNETPLPESRSAALPRASDAAVPPVPSHEISPGVFSMAGSFARSMADFAANGFKVVSRESFDERLDICRSCENLSGTQCRLWVLCEYQSLACP